MAKHNAVEIATGALVLLGAASFLAFALANTGTRIRGGYELTASFDHVDGLASGSEVRIAGVKIGSVEAITLDHDTFQALVKFTVADGVALTTDSSASVASDGLLGGKYLAIETGGEDKNLGPGGHITITQGSMNLESLIGKYIFGSTGNGLGDGKAPAKPDAAKDAAGAGLK